jgi:hypothetical protein
MTITSSIVRPPWICAECGHSNTDTTARCMNKRYDETSPRYLAIPPVPSRFSLRSFGEYLEELGLKDVPPPAIVWECPGRLQCPVAGCDSPARAYGHGPRCEAHSDVMAILEARE